MISGIKNQKIKKISYIIISIHLLCIIYINIYSEKKPREKEKKITVKTFQSNPAVPITKIQTIKKNPTTPSTTPSPKKETPKAPVKKAEPKVLPKKTTPITKNSPPTEKKTEIKAEKKQAPEPQVKKKKNIALEKSLKEIKESIAKIEAENDRIRTSLPSKSATLEEEILPNDYASSLVCYLQEQLQLPDIGEVKIQITLFPNGTVEKMTVLSAESEKNKKRIQENLPNLQFPPFPKNARNLDKQTFILTFCNEI